MTAPWPPPFQVPIIDARVINDNGIILHSLQNPLLYGFITNIAYELQNDATETSTVNLYAGIPIHNDVDLQNSRILTGSTIGVGARVVSINPVWPFVVQPNEGLLINVVSPTGSSMIRRFTLAYFQQQSQQGNGRGGQTPPNNTALTGGR